MNFSSPRASQPVILFTVILFSLIFWVYAPLRNADFINYDDPVLVTGNSFIRDLSWAGIKNILTTSASGVYIPLTEFVFAVEYHFFDYDPRVFHLTNLVFHLAVCYMVMTLGWRMGLPLPAGLLGALIFGVHPMHVESVAWVTELKDVLYAFFYLMAVHKYIDYLHAEVEARRRWAYGAVLVCGLLSSLAKPMAVSLPLVLLIFDGYFNRPRSVKIFWDKISIAFVVFPSVVITYLLNLRQVVWSWPESFLLWNWTMIFYPFKFFELGDYTYLYWLSRPLSWANPVYSWAVAVTGVFLVLLWMFRKNRWLVFAVVYYVASAVFLFRMEFSSHLNMVSDRFMYLPSLGICLAAGCCFWKAVTTLSRRFLSWGLTAGIAICLTIILGLAVKGRQQVRVWENSETFWSHQLSVDPRPAMGLSLYQLGYAIMIQEGLASLMTDIPSDQEMYVYPDQRLLSRIEQADHLFDQALAIKQDFTSVYYFRGILNLRLGRHAQARQEFERALSIEPSHFLSWFALGRLNLLQGEPQAGVEAFHRAQVAIPDHPTLRDDILRAYQHRIDAGDPYADIYRREMDRMAAEN